MGFVSGIISDVIQYVKQNEIDKAQKILNEKIETYYQEEVKDRRTKVSELNRSIIHIDIELKKLDIQYNLIHKLLPGSMITSIDQYIYDLKKRRVEFELLKNRISKLE